AVGTAQYVPPAHRQFHDCPPIRKTLFCRSRERGGFGRDRLGTFHFRNLASPSWRPCFRPRRARGSAGSWTTFSANHDNLSWFRRQNSRQGNFGKEPVA